MESKEQFKSRLKTEGRWNEFIDYRESLKANGIDPKEAWARAREKFQPGSEGPGKADSPDDPGMASGGGVSSSNFADKQPVSARQVVQWVFDNIDVDDVEPGDAPSSGAWSFLQRVRKHPDLLKEFYRSIWAKMLPTRSEIEAREKFEDDGRQQLHLIEQIRRARGAQDG